MAATPVGLVVIAIAALAAGFVLADNKLEPFHDAVNTAFVLHQELWSWLSGTLALHQLQHRVQHRA
jgi:phage-related protein